MTKRDRQLAKRLGLSEAEYLRQQAETIRRIDPSERGRRYAAKLIGESWALETLEKLRRKLDALERKDRARDKRRSAL